MDDRRFDALTRALASGRNRRQLLKGLLGLGSAVATGAAVTEVQAARRPTPTPRPVTCPGSQIWNGSECVCPSGTKCGPDCCADGQSECCDNACCYGTCYGEELCCPTGRDFCAGTGECCAEGWSCCPEYGCISPEQCCSSTDCPPDVCYSGACADGQTCQYVFDCTNDDGGNCCPAPACLRSECLEDGSCSEPAFDCTNDDGGGCCIEDWTCCPGLGCLPPGQCCTSDDCVPETCFAGICTDVHTCEFIDDCTNDDGSGCCAEDQVCLENGTCCTPNCPSDYLCGDDGCGGTCACPEGQGCQNGACTQPCVSGTRCGSCGDCQCYADVMGLVSCMDKNTAVGPCSSDADCPAGTYCSNFLSGDPFKRNLCVYPCCGAP